MPRHPDIFNVIDQRILDHTQRPAEGIILSLQTETALVLRIGTTRPVPAKFNPADNPAVGKRCLMLWVPSFKKYVIFSVFSPGSSISAADRPETGFELAPPANVITTSLINLIQISWDVPPQQSVTFEVQYNTIADEDGAITIATTRGGNVFYGVDGYFRVRSVSASFHYSSWSDWAAGSIISITSAISEVVQDIVAALSVAGANISITYDDALGTLTFAVTGIGTTLQAYDADLAAIAALTSTGFLKRTGSNTWTLNTLTSADISDATADATASKIALRDSAINFAVNMVEQGMTSAATTGTTVTLTAASPPGQRFDGSIAQDVVLPVATTLRVGHWYFINNRSTATITVKDSAGTTLNTLLTLQHVMIYLRDNSTAAGLWAATGSAVTETLTGKLFDFALNTVTPNEAFISARTEDTAPVETDYLLTDDVSAAALRKVLLSKLRASRVSNNDVTATPTHADFTLAFGAVPEGFHAFLADNGSLTTEYLVSYHNARWHYVAMSQATFEALVAYVSALTDLSLYFPLADSLSVITPAINPTRALGRNLLDNPLLDAAANYTLSDGTVVHNTGAQRLEFTASAALVSQTPTVNSMVIAGGKTYRYTYTITNYSGSGSLTPKLGGTNGTARTANGLYTDDILADAANAVMGWQAAASFNGYLSLLSVQQVTLTASGTWPPTQLLTDADMEAATAAAYTAVNSANLTKSTVAPKTGVRNLRVARNGANNPAARQTPILGPGKRALLRGWAKGDATAVPRVLHAATIRFTGTNSTTYQAIDTNYLIASGSNDFDLQAQTSTTTTFAEFDDFDLRELNYADLTISGATVDAGDQGQPLLVDSMLFDGVNDFLNLGTGKLNSFWNWDEGTLSFAIKMVNAASYTDGANHTFVSIANAGSTERVFAGISTSFSGGIQFRYVGGGVTIQYNHTTLSTAWQMITMKWSRAGNWFKVFVNEVLATTITGLPTLDRTTQLNQANCCMGCNSTSANSPTNAYMGHLLILADAESDAQTLIRCQLAGVAS